MLVKSWNLEIVPKRHETSVAATATPVNNYAAPAATANSAELQEALYLAMVIPLVQLVLMQHHVWQK